MPLSSFTLNMNMVFERFLGRYLSEHCPDDVRIGMQDVRSDVFSYLENAGGWNQPTIRPDFVFRRRKQSRRRRGCEVQESPREPAVVGRVVPAHDLRAGLRDARAARGAAPSSARARRVRACDDAALRAVGSGPAGAHPACGRAGRRPPRRHGQAVVAAARRAFGFAPSRLGCEPARSAVMARADSAQETLRGLPAT
jgi:hypothetical protein